MQLETWKGDFGDAYTARQPDSTADREVMWRRVLRSVQPKPKSVLEVGANRGLNLKAWPYGGRLCGLEPNETAASLLQESGFGVVEGSAVSIAADKESFDLVFTCGVLIHIPPVELFRACREIHWVSKRHILAIEYFAAEPEEKEYRGQGGMLWKRDFGSFWMDNFDLMPVDSGFFWKRTTGLDNLTWWLFEK